MFETIDNIIRRDPAARSRLQVFLTYPGYKALRSYRLAHYFWQRGYLLLAELIASHSRKKTGIEIHPGAQIGQHVFIDHGLGIVIGETAIVGDDVTIMHGVTLGSRRIIDGRRHPVVGDRTFIGANALILGNIKIGKDVKVGAGTVILKDVPDKVTVVGNPARIIKN